MAVEEITIKCSDGFLLAGTFFNPQQPIPRPSLLNLFPCALILRHGKCELFKVLSIIGQDGKKGVSIHAST